MLEDIFKDSPAMFCDQARELAREVKSAQEFWHKAQQGDWLLWFAAAHDVDIKQLVKAAAGCARLVFEFLPEGEDLCQNALDMAERWAAGELGAEKCAAAGEELYAHMEDVAQDLNDEIMYLAAAIMSAVGACEAVVNAAGHSHKPELAKTLATRAAGRVAVTFRHAQGPDSMAQAHARCAEIVRANIEWQPES